MGRSSSGANPRPVPLPDDPHLAELRQRLSRGGTCRAGGLWGGALSLVAAALRRDTAPPPLVALFPRSAEADDVARDLEGLLPGGEPERVQVLPAMDLLGTGVGGIAPGVLSERLSALTRLHAQPPAVLCLSVLSLLEPFPHPAALDRAGLHLGLGQRLSLDELERRLERAGLTGVPLVEAPGQFSRRRDLVDLFPFAEELPLRVEVDAGRIDSLRRFRVEDQMSCARPREVEISLLRAEVAVGEDAPSASLADYLPSGTVLLVRDPDRIREESQSLLQRKDAAARLARGAGEAAALDPVPILLGKLPRLEASALPVEGADVTFRTLAPAAGPRGLADLGRTVGAMLERCTRVVILCPNEADRDRLREVLREAGVGDSPGLHCSIGSIHAGFEAPDWRLAVVNHTEILSRTFLRPPPTAARAVREARRLLRDLTAGDYVVHATHGIGRFLRLERGERGGAAEDFLVLEFEHAVQVQVPVSRMDLVQRYVGTGDRLPSLDRIGGTAWARRRARVSEAVSRLAKDLVETQALRERVHGITFPPDDDLQGEFEASFPYEDTEDQRRSCEEIKRDLESPAPMDRLLCGDVGYGKTEVALRAAFKVVGFGRQVAVLVPTTVLAEQHLQTFRQRLQDYPITVAAITRFRTRREQREILERARDGRLDILIGTHRLFQPDVTFRDLGLLVVDEEQRFGVEHKEALKRLRRTVDVLTMTATPIPRTLHQALLGLRDISSLQAPPAGRQAIHTSILAFDEEEIRSAILFELDRDGQVFFVHNRIATIEGIRRRLERICPEARYEVVHGRLPGDVLEERMVRFVEGKVDVLLCTTIVENGLDIPRANTIFIDQVHRYGLADLHQLRGRVGRYDRPARCYLILPAGGVKEVAAKRLKAIESLNYLGAGFHIALKDLEIRGAGNLLGPEQHGHIRAVGYDLYCKMLRRASAELRRHPPAQDEDVDLEIGVPAYLPEDAIPDLRQRMDLYRRLSQSRDAGDLARLEEEFRDRYGKLPCEVRRLLDLFDLRRRCRAHGIRRLVRLPDGTFAVEPPRPRALREAAARAGWTLRAVTARRGLLLAPAARADALDSLRALLADPPSPAPRARKTKGGRRAPVESAGRRVESAAKEKGPPP